MRRLTALAVSLLALTACGGVSDAAIEARENLNIRDGQQTYEDVYQLRDDLASLGVDCTGIREDGESTWADTQARCETDGEELVLFTFTRGSDRDGNLDAIADLFGEDGLDFGYCMVAGTGRDGLWMVNVGGDQLELCAQIGALLGGEVVTNT